MKFTLSTVLGMLLMSASGMLGTDNTIKTTTAYVTPLGSNNIYKTFGATRQSLDGFALHMSTTSDSKVDDKTEVREYFNTEGFNRWNKIYSDSDEVNSVQMDIRDGHQQTIDKILKWIQDDANIAGQTVCDCGCGVGSLAIPLAQMGAKVSASDISSSMADEAGRRAKELGLSEKQATFFTSDLETVKGKYDTVTCVDVAIHYPTDQMKGMVGHLCSLANDRVIFSFAPDTWYYSLLKKVGELFPGPSKTTRAYLHPEAAVRDALKQSGFEITREEMTGTNFYFSRLFEAKRIQ